MSSFNTLSCLDNYFSRNVYIYIYFFWSYHILYSLFFPIALVTSGGGGGGGGGGESGQPPIGALQKMSYAV